MRRLLWVGLCTAIGCSGAIDGGGGSSGGGGGNENNNGCGAPSTGSMNPGGHLPPYTPPPIPNGTLTIPTGHPHLWWTPERITRARAWVQAHNFQPDSSDPLAQAFAYVATGNTTYAQNAITWLRTVQ